MLKDGELERATEMAAALARGDVSPAELMERALERARSWQPVTNAFSQIWDEALEDARLAADAGGGTSSDRAPVLGVPLAVKDLFDVAGRETSGCSDAYRGRIAQRDAPIVGRLVGAGSILMGKTNQHELAAGGTNLVSACGRTHNPWDPARMTGGSSGGSGAAVAAGVVPWALGSDTGGSVRIPASMCGTFGLKPTTGRFSIEGLLPLGPSLDCPGPMASTSEDLWLLYGLMGGRDEAERLSPPLHEAAGRAFRVGLPDGFFADLVHPEVSAAVEATARVLEGVGASIEPVDGRGIDDARSVWSRVCYPEFAAAHPGIDRALLDPSVRSWMEEGERFGPDLLAEATGRREEIGRWFRERLAPVDALLIPTTPYAAPRADQAEVDLGQAGRVPVSRVGPGWITCSVNLAGLPAVSVPAGRSSYGLPVGVSLVGKDGQEETVVRLAAVWEAASGYRPSQPPLPG